MSITPLEEWREVPSVPLLMASSLGRVASRQYVSRMPNGGSRVRQIGATFGVWDGRRFIVVFRRKSYRVARLICEAFNGPPPFDGAVCMHGDENSRNNTPDNLSWGTQKENLNAPGFLRYCRSRTGENSPVIKGKRNKAAPGRRQAQRESEAHSA